MTLDRGGDRSSKHIEDVLLLGHLTDVLDVLLAQTWFLFFSEETRDTSSHDLSPESASGHTHVHIGSSSVDASDFDAVTRLDAIDKVVLQDDGDTARQLAWWCALRHLLDRDDLGVLVQAVSILVHERIAILVLHREVLRSVGGIVLILAHLSQVSVVVVVTDLAPPCCLAIMH